MDLQMRQLWELLGAEGYVTSAQIAAAMGISRKTAQTKLKQLDGELRKNGARVIARPRAGYRLEITEAAAYERWREKAWFEEGLPNTAAERIGFMLAYLLNHMDYVKLEDISQLLCVSRNTVTACLKQVESIVNEFYLKIDRRPNYGVRLVGSELDRRTCIARCLLGDGLYPGRGMAREEDLQTLAGIVREAAQAFRMGFSEYAYESVVHYLYVSCSRIRHGQTMDAQPRLQENVEEKFVAASRYIALEAGRQLEVAYSEAEILYLALQLRGKANDGMPAEYSHMVISSRIDGLALKMLHTVFEVNRLDFRDNLELRLSLNQHLVPLDIRMRYNICLKNPILEQIRKGYAYAYMVAATACTALKEYYGKAVPEDEIGYVAVLFALAIERQDKVGRKYNLVMVCVSGHGTSRLFMHKYRQIFGKYIHKMFESTISDLKEFDFAGQEIDYIFTTVPAVRLHAPLPVPVFEISLFLDDAEVDAYRRMFEMEGGGFLHRYFAPELFLGRVCGETKEEILRQMCAWVQKEREVPEDFYELVWKREEMGQTDFGNLVAIPHPWHTIGREKFVMTAVLSEPVWWGHHDVQVVFLISLSEEEDGDIEEFYRTVTNFWSSRELVERVIEEPEYAVLLAQLMKAAKK